MTQLCQEVTRRFWQMGFGPVNIFDPMLADLSIACTQLAHSAANLAAQQSAQRCAICITDLRSNQINAVAARPQKMYGALDTKILKI